MKREVLFIASFLLVPVIAFAQQPKPIWENGTPVRPDAVNLMDQFKNDEVKETAEIDPVTGEVIAGKMYLKTPEAKAIADEVATAIANPTVAASATPRHPYEVEGDTAGVNPSDNHLHDFTSIVSEFVECLDYEILSQECINPVLGPTPYVKYFLPYQKIESVDQPFKTGYFEKYETKPARDALDAAMASFGEYLAQGELNISTAIVNNQFNLRYGNALLSGPLLPAYEAYRQKAVDEVRNNIDIKRRVRHQDGSTLDSGIAFNEYHVMQSIPIDPVSLFYLFDALGYLDFTAALMHTTWTRKYCHVPIIKPISTWFSEAAPIVSYARSWEPYLSGAVFANEALERANIPRSCSAFNISPHPLREIGFDSGSIMRTPYDLVEDLVSAADISPSGGAVCQGVNQAPWFPPFNTTQTSFHTTSAAVGTVKGAKIAAEVQDPLFYTYSLDNIGLAYDPDNDKVQWTRGKFMDDPAYAPSQRKCARVEKWLQRYKGPGLDDANVKRTELTDSDNPPDHWAVAIHWRYFRCCVDPNSYWGGGSDSPPVFNNERRQ